MEKDDFILDALRTNSKLKKIYVTFTNSDNYDVLSKKFSEDKIGNKTIVFVMIGESEIWEDVKPMKSVLTQV
jgi:hypothetical protein